MSFLVIGLPATMIPVNIYEGNTPPPLSPAMRVLQIVAFVALAGVLAGPVLSHVALKRIQQSAGKLYGSGLAALGLWLLPVILGAGVAGIMLTSTIQIVLGQSGLSESVNQLVGVGLLIGVALILRRKFHMSGSIA